MSRPYHLPFARVPADMCGNANHAGLYVKVDAVVALMAHEAAMDERVDVARRLSMLAEDIALGAARFEGALDGRL